MTNIASHWAPAKEQQPRGDFRLICRYCIGGCRAGKNTGDCAHCNGLGDTKITWDEALREYGGTFVKRVARLAGVTLEVSR